MIIFIAEGILAMTFIAIAGVFLYIMGRREKKSHDELKMETGAFH